MTNSPISADVISAWLRSSICFCTCAAASVRAEVIASSVVGFVSEHELNLEADSRHACQALSEPLGEWSDAAHSHGGVVANLSPAAYLAGELTGEP